MKSSYFSLVAAGNTYNPCLLVAYEKGYELWVDPRASHNLWCARSGAISFVGDRPPELLGVITLWETLGDQWNARTENVLRAIIPSDIDINASAPPELGPSSLHTIVSGVDVYNQCLIVIKAKGFSVWVEREDQKLYWNARIRNSSFLGYSPPELLGIIALWERLGNDWNQQLPWLLGELVEGGNHVVKPRIGKR